MREPLAGRTPAALFAKLPIIAYWADGGQFGPSPCETSPPMTSPTLRAGLVGYGFAGQTFHAPVLSAVPGLELAAVASS